MAAQFETLGDTGFRLPDNTGNKRTLSFNLPNLDRAMTVVLMFKVAMSGSNRLRMRINDNQELSIDFNLDPPLGLGQRRSWHEIMGPNEGFKESGNVLTVTHEGGDQEAEATVSDIVFLYHGRTQGLVQDPV